MLVYWRVCSICIFLFLQEKSMTFGHPIQSKNTTSTPHLSFQPRKMKDGFPGPIVGGFNPIEKYYSSQIWSFPQIGMNIKNISNHHLGIFVFSFHVIFLGGRWELVNWRLENFRHLKLSKLGPNKHPAEYHHDQKRHNANAEYLMAAMNISTKAVQNITLGFQKKMSSWHLF